jgi:hypothetical protein
MQTKSKTSTDRSTKFHPDYTSTTARGLRVLTATRRGSTGTEVGKEGEGTPVKAAAEILVTTGAQAPAMALGLRRGRAQLGANGGLDFGGECWLIKHAVTEILPPFFCHTA